jgi:two-component system CheB/CheR fusion protein
VHRQDNRALAVAIIVAIVTFVAGLDLPLGVDIAALYGISVLLALYVRLPGFSFYAATVVTLLTALGAWLAPPGGAVAYAIVNRVLTLVGIWVTAWLIWRTKQTGRALDVSTKNLADTSFAINQAAIVATTNVKGEITFANDKFVEISKYPREELLGQDHRIINSGYHSKEFMRELWTTIANGRIWRGELRNRAKDGTFYWVDTTIVPFLNELRKPYQYMAIRYDITDRKRSEERLREQAALARLGEMAAVVAHEVKNPLAAIKGALQVIGGRLPPESRDRLIVADVVARVDSLNDIVQDLLVFARPREPKLTPVSVAELLESTAILVRKDPAHPSIGITVSGARPIVPLDIEQMRTVFLNVLLNAAQASGSSGRIDVTIGTDEAAAMATIAIADDGPGIPPEVRPKVFEPFFTTKHRGTGLGLPTARRVVERHRGTIDIDCPPSGGTIVTLTLPMH